MQEKLHREISDVLSEHSGRIDHETIVDMVYLDAVLAENLRMFPPVIMHNRVCVKDCQVIIEILYCGNLLGSVELFRI